MSETSGKNIWRWEAGGALSLDRDVLASEEPLEIRIDGRPVSVTMRTPGHDDELAVGFLLSEGLIAQRDQVRRVEQNLSRADCNVVNVRLAADVRVNFEQLTRHVFASSSCGLCGKATIDAVQRQFPPVAGDVRVAAATLLGLPERLRLAQPAFDTTGGLHAAAVFDLAGAPIAVREDVGRHNAVDKVLGYGLLNGLPPFDHHILLVSGRASFEILQKALAGRIPIIAAVSAPSTLAVEFAEQSRQTLVGFLRGPRMNVYSGRERIEFDW